MLTVCWMGSASQIGSSFYGAEKKKKKKKKKKKMLRVQRTVRNGDEQTLF